MDGCIDYKKNSLNLFRLLAAIQVLYGHAIGHLQLSTVPVFGGIINFFSGVPIFFTLSGFLIWQAIGRSNTFEGYAKKRFWRIFPELWVAVALEIVVLLILYHHPIDWPKLGIFAICQATIFQFWTPDFLRGYGCGTPNGALWTITVLIQFYFFVYFLHKWLRNRRLCVWGGVIAVSLIIAWFTPHIIRALPVNIGKIYNVSIFPYLWMFLVSALVAEYKENIVPFLKKYWWLILVLLIANRYCLHLDINLSMYPFINTILLFVVLLGVAYAIPQINIKIDISYGVYIYHMTIINALIALGFVGQSWTLWVVLLLTCIMAWISTITVGRFSLRKKQVV